MKGRKSFTLEEINKIKNLLRNKNNAPSEEQKPYRDQIRKIGFYISDFRKSNKGFSDEDFDDLINQNIITIINHTEN